MFQAEIMKEKINVQYGCNMRKKPAVIDQEPEEKKINFKLLITLPGCQKNKHAHTHFHQWSKTTALHASLICMK